MKYDIPEQPLEYHVALAMTDGSQPVQLSYYRQYLKRGEWSSQPIIRNDYKLSLFATSGIVCVVGSKIYPILPGSILLLRPYETHYGNIRESGMQEYFEFNIPGSLFERMADAHTLIPHLTDEQGQPVNLLLPGEAYRSQLFAQARRLLSDMEENTAESRMRCYITLLSCLSLIRDCCGADRLPLRFDTPQLIVRAISLIMSQLSSALTVESLAAQLFVSPSYLSRLFRQWLDITPYQYILTARISRACQLLDGTCSVTDVAYQCGFVDCSNFIAIFRRHMGLTPREYAQRRKALSDEPARGAAGAKIQV